MTARVKPFENIQVLGERAGGDVHRILEKLHLGVKIFGHDAVQDQGLAEQAEDLEDPDKGGLGDQAQVNAVDQILEQSTLTTLSMRKVSPRALNLASLYEPYMEGMSTAKWRLW